MLQPKDKDWLNGCKNKTHIYSVNKGPTSDLEAHTDWERGDRKGIPCKWKSEEPEVVILISDKTDIQIQTVTRDKEGPCMMIKRSTSDLGKHTEWKWGVGKRYSMQMEIKRKWE